MNGRILAVDDDRSMCELLEAGLVRAGYEVLWRTAPEEALDLIATRDLDAIVTDLQMRSMNGLELCARITANHPDLPVVVLTAFGSQETAVGAIRAGAYDFITKPIEIDAVDLVLRRAVQHRQLRQEVKRLREAAAGQVSFPGLIGKSPVMQRVRELIGRVLDSDASVLISGETGTGKEVVARELHHRGRHQSGPFVAINCAALPEPLLESELFGHARGAFTDAHTARTGLLVQASRGTIFLDEIGELALGLQPKLLRALEERTVRPIGGTSEVAFDARVIAATSLDLEAAVAQGRFREDLFFRVNVVQIALPPLRVRGSDVLLLAQHFVKQHAEQAGRPVVGLSAPAAAVLLSYSWPGNVRELKNCIERAVALAHYDQITVDDLPERIRSSNAPRVRANDDFGDLLPLEEIERRHITRVLEAVGENKTLAAQILGLDRKTLYRKLDRYAKMDLDS